VLHEFTNTILVIVSALFPVINPPASGFIVLSLVPDATPAQRARLAWTISLYGFAILLVSLSIGAYVLSFFGISIPILRVAGGLVIANAGWKLLNSSAVEKNGRSASAEAADDASLSSLAFYPLTLPITVGPGSIAVAIALATGSPSHGPATVHLVAVGVALLILCASIYVCVRFSANVERRLGAVGSQVAMRLFAFIVFCIGMQILWLGVSGLLETLPSK